MKRAVILILFLGIFLISVSYVSAVISCGSQTYPDGTGYCCDTGNGANGVWFRGDYYSSCPSAPGNYRYVSNSGNDTNNGLTPATAWGTMDKVNDDILPGQTAIILGGVWNEQGIQGPAGPNPGQIRDCYGLATTLVPDRRSQGSFTNPIIVKGHPDYTRPIITGNGFDTAYSVRCSEGHCLHRPVCIVAGLVLDHFEITNGWSGIRGHTNDVILQDLIIHDVYGSSGDNNGGISTAYWGTNNLIIRGNELHHVYAEDFGGDGWNPSLGSANTAPILLYRTINATIEDNIIHDHSHGIVFKNGISKSTVRRNVIYNVNTPIRDGCSSASGYPSENNQFYENVIYDEPGAIYYPWFTVTMFWEDDTNYAGPCIYDVINASTFNNVFYNKPNRGFWLFNPNDNFFGFSYLNNIYSNEWHPPSPEKGMLYILTPSNLVGFKSDNNIYFDTIDSNLIRWGGTFYNLATYRGISGLDLNSMQTNPLFLSTTPGDPNFLRPNPLTSPAIDGGVKVPGYHCNVSASIDPTQTGCKLWYGSAPDIGAHEYNPGIPIVTCQQADVNDDLIINIIDLALVIYNQGQGLIGRGHLDIDSTGQINYQDVSEVRSRLGQSC